MMASETGAAERAWVGELSDAPGAKPGPQAQNSARPIAGQPVLRVTEGVDTNCARRLFDS